MYTFPKPLRPGDTIAIVAPSAALADDDLQEGVDFIRSLGYDVKLGQSVGAHWGYLAGTDELRAQDIHEAFGDDGRVRRALPARRIWGGPAAAASGL